MEEKVDSSVNSTVVLLDEIDIPGAKLPKPVEQCTCSVLRRWLLCRGAKTTGRLGELKQRLVHSSLHKLVSKENIYLLAFIALLLC